MTNPIRIPITAAILHFGRKPDGYGGRIALAKCLGVTSNSIGRWAGPFLPEHHAKKLLRKDHTASSLVVESTALNDANASRVTDRTRKAKKRLRKPA